MVKIHYPVHRKGRHGGSLAVQRTRHGICLVHHNRRRCIDGGTLALSRNLGGLGSQLSRLKLENKRNIRLEL